MPWHGIDFNGVIAFSRMVTKAHVKFWNELIRFLHRATQTFKRGYGVNLTTVHSRDHQSREFKTILVQCTSPKRSDFTKQVDVSVEQALC